LFQEKGATAALDHAGAARPGGIDGADGGDPVVLDEHVAGIGVGAGGVQDLDVPEEGRGHDGVSPRR
jgi:hypothetical protein